MREISAFDIIGPIMVGPSSSHTAGALKIARIAGKLSSKKIVDVSFRLYGSFAKTFRGHGTDRALLGGILGMEADDLDIKNSFGIAHRRGVEFEFIADAIPSAISTLYFFTRSAPFSPAITAGRSTFARASSS